MSNLDNAFQSCPGLMADGRTSVITDYKSKNESFKEIIGTSTNSYQFRNKLQTTGFSSLKDVDKYITCSSVPFGNINFNKTINMEYNTTGSFLDAFKPLAGNVKPNVTTMSS